METTKKYSKVTYIAAAVLIIPSLLFGGWILWKLWGWIIVPLGAPLITYWHAVGIAALINYLKPNANIKSIDGDEELWIQVGAAVLTDLCALLTGYIVHLLMIA